MGKAKMLGQFKPCIPNAKAAGKHGRKAPWQGSQKKGGSNHAAKQSKA